nr:MAG TPA: hypothetical protein [Bacteriophage sp.]
MRCVLCNLDRVCIRYCQYLLHQDSIFFYNKIIERPFDIVNGKFYHLFYKSYNSYSLI